MLFGLLACSVSVLINLVPTLQFARTIPMHLFFLGQVIGFQVKALCLLVAIVVADRAVEGGARRRLAYSVAVLGGCAAGVLFSESFGWAWRTFVLPDQWPVSRPYLRGAGSFYYFPIYELTSWLLLGGSAVFFYADRRAAHKTQSYLRAAELDRIRRSKLALESRLQAMQARVEPRFLFNTLAQVESLYDLKPVLAARMLDDLITYLRAAMPLMRDTASTVAQEIELARSYLDIVKVRLGERLSYDIQIAPGMSEIRMPPMMLLPLIDHAITYGLERSGAEGSIRIASEVRAGRLRLTITDTGTGLVQGSGAEGLASIRERLAALYRGDARLDLRDMDVGAAEAIMDIPFESAPDVRGISPAVSDIQGKETS